MATDLLPVELKGGRTVLIRSLTRREMTLISAWGKSNMDKQLSLVVIAAVADDPQLGFLGVAELNVELEKLGEAAVVELLDACVDYAETKRLVKASKNRNPRAGRGV